MIVTTKQLNITLFIFQKKALKDEENSLFINNYDYDRLLRLKIKMMINGLLMHKMGSKIKLNLLIEDERICK